MLQVVDMFGCGLPVCSADYHCIRELVSPGRNGLLFRTANELADNLVVMQLGFVSACGYRAGLGSLLSPRNLRSCLWTSRRGRHRPWRK